MELPHDTVCPPTWDGPQEPRPPWDFGGVQDVVRKASESERAVRKKENTTPITKPSTDSIRKGRYSLEEMLPNEQRKNVHLFTHKYFSETFKYGQGRSIWYPIQSFRILC